VATVTATATDMTAAELIQAHQAGIWRYLRFLGCDEALADDMTQETFLAVLRKPFQQRSHGETSAYLRTVARHKFLRAVRRSRRAPTIADLEMAERVWVEAHPRENGNEFLDALEECLKQLNGRSRTAIDRRYRDGFSRAQIAEEMDMTEDGVKTLLRRTRNSLRGCIKGRLES